MKSKNVKILFLASIGVTISLIIWFLIVLGKAGFLSFNKPISPEISSYVGGFIGGVIGCILSFVTLIILYQTYKSQISDARDEKLRGSIDLLTSMHESIVVDIKELEFVDDHGKIHKGPTSIVYYEQKTQGPDIFIDKLNYIINSYKILLSECRKRINSYHNTESIETASALLDRFYLSFYTKIIWLIILEKHEYDGIEYRPFETYQKIAKETLNDDAIFIFQSFSEIGEDAFKYLGERKLIAIENTWKKRSLERIRSFRALVNRGINK